MLLLLTETFQLTGRVLFFQGRRHSVSKTDFKFLLQKYALYDQVPQFSAESSVCPRS